MPDIDYFVQIAYLFKPLREPVLRILDQPDYYAFFTYSMFHSKVAE